MPPNTNPQHPILLVGLGEALFDCFSNRRTLGGAPVNLAVHANALLNRVGGRSTIVTRVGEDDLGDLLVKQLLGKDLSRDYIQRDREHPTGMVDVNLDSAGQADYEIHENAAWDHLRFDAELAELAPACGAVCFGTLAQRHPVTRAAIYAFLDAAPQAIRFLDVNLREPYFSAAIIKDSLHRATVAKLNEHELPLVCAMLGLDAPPGEAHDHQAQAIIQSFGLDLLALTRGARGTVLYRDGQRVEGSPVKLQPGPNADSVGAGDACSAALVSGLLLGLGDQQIGDWANQVGAYVAGLPGATPDLPEKLLAQADLKVNVNPQTLSRSMPHATHQPQRAAGTVTTKS